MRRDARFGSADALSYGDRGGPRANLGLGFPSSASYTSSVFSTSFASYFYPSLLSSRNGRKLLKINDRCASYPSLKPGIDRHKNGGSNSLAGCTLAAVWGRRDRRRIDFSSEGE
jgi:hypothetical protein